MSNDSESLLEQSKRIVCKATNAETAKRVEEIKELLCNGYGRSKIVRFCAERYNLRSRQAEVLMARATAEIKEANSSPPEELAAKIAANFWKQYRKAEKNEDGHLAISAMRELAKLCGLDQIVVNHIISEKKELDQIPDDIINAEFTDVDDE